ncbi:MAG TPA: phosphotransferase [Frateuria sp.]|uniref:phosphotransferase n=1 Tax=Frateuria sp. TaxID=2211372 RepID=UPI002DE7D3E8|nr:phosphotransferase [Frateuria sp.]
MLPKSDWAHLIPHAGDMCLLDAVLAWDEHTVHACSDGHARADHPLRGPHGLHAVHLVEFGAQAMAVHGALLARARGIERMRPGLLVSLREVALAIEYVSPGGRLDVHSHCMYADDAGAQYAFRVEQAGRVLASGRAAVIHPDEALP